MTYEEFNAFCASLPAATHVVQWGGSHVWKVGGKVFAIGGWNKDGAGITFKVSELSYEILKDQRGMKWIQHYAKPGLADEDLKAYLSRSHRIVSQGLPKKTRRALGLKQE